MGVNSTQCSYSVEVGTSKVPLSLQGQHYNMTSSEKWASVKKVVEAKIDDLASVLNDISQDIWSHPQLNFEETHAHKVLTDFLEKEGFKVARHHHLETAFTATYGTDGGIHVGVMCEYDALPEIGHACGHNLIAECGAAAGLGIKAVLEMEGAPKGRVTIFGTPAEEGGGGKVDLIKAGTFEGIDVAVMAHPFAQNVLSPVMLSRLAIQITYRGFSAHAAATPWEGRNALDAAVMCYSTISAMRQQFKPEWRVHGIICRGGVKPNIIPDETEMEYYIRAPTQEELETLKEKVLACARGAAMSTQCEVQFKEGVGYKNLITNPTLASLYLEQSASFGLEFEPAGPSGSTDMGDVSHVVPSIHPMFGINTMAPNHSNDFTKASGAPEAQAPTLLQGKVMALTCLQLMQPGNEQLMEKIKAEFAQQTGGAKA